MLTDAEIGALVAVVIVLATAAAGYLDRRATVRKIDELHARVDSVSRAVGVPTDPPVKRF